MGYKYKIGDYVKINNEAACLSRHGKYGYIIEQFGDDYIIEVNGYKSTISGNDIDLINSDVLLATYESTKRSPSLDAEKLRDSLITDLEKHTITLDVKNPVYVKLDKERKPMMGRSLKIVDYKVIEDKVVICKFADGNEQKAICDPKDTFDFEHAIEICVMKQKCGDSNTYNTIVSKALKDIKKIDKDRADFEKRIKEEDEIEKRHYEKVQARKKQRAEKLRQARINEMAEAYVKAMKEYGSVNIPMDSISTSKDK